MLARILAVFLFATCIAPGAGQAAVRDQANPSLDEIGTAEHAFEFVADQEKNSYQQVLDLYRHAQSERPRDASLALAQCKFIERFTWSDDLAWSDLAAKDFEACRTALDKRFSTNPEAALYVLEHRFGADAIAYGAPLVARSNDWDATQRARLHSAISRGYATVRDETRAGQEAVLAVQLDPASDRLVDAMRYLAKTGRAQDAGKLLSAAPVAKLPWQEVARIKAAVDILPPSAASDEMHRAQRAGLKIDAYTTAGVLQRAGDSTGAAAALNTDVASRKFESPQNRQLRLDVAFDSGNAKVAADIIRDQYQKTGSAAPLAYAYAHLLDLDPAIAARADLLPLAGSLLGILAFYLASPGLLLFPAHYRGTVRQRMGKVSMPLFARIGLRHAWWALTAFFSALWLVAIFRSGTASLSIGGGVTRVDAPSRLAISHLWSMLFSALALVVVGRLISWREWIGSVQLKLAWVFVPVALCGFSQFAHPPIRNLVSQGPAPSSWPVILTHGALALGGIPLALLLLSVLVPIIEELVYRGCLLGGLSRHISFGWANVLQALLFAGMHDDRSHLIYLFLLGLTAGWLARKTKGLSMSILLHAFNNAIFVLGIATV